MRKRKASYVLSNSDERSDDDEKSDIKSEGTSEESEEPSEESLSQSSSDRDNADTEQPNGEQRKEPSEEPSEESVSQPLAESDNDETDRETEEPTEEPSENSVCQPSSDSDTEDTEHQSESVLISLNEKKRPLDTTACESGPLQVCRSPKKCKQEHSLKPESDVGSAVTDLESKSGISKPESFVNDDNTSEQQERTGSSGKRRRSRWDPQPDGDGEAGEDDRTSKRRKTRWAVDDSQLKMLGPIQLPDFMREFVVGSDFDPEIRELNMKLLEINRKLRGSEVHDDRTEEERSPSPQPVYNNLGIRINSRDIRFREKLILDRQYIISRLIQKNSTFKPPSDYNPPKLYKKIYIPLKEYPGYNFVGLIIGPRGNTQKRMEKETGARIVIRGKGSTKGQSHQKPDPSDNEDLHVLVEADNQKSLDAAVGMVEKLLIPVDERMNQHKLAQLKELAELKGTLRDENLCKVYGEHGQKYPCPSLKTTFKVDVACDTCGGSSHSTANCPLTASAPGSNVDFEGHNFLADLKGGGGLTFATFPTSSSKPGGFSNSVLGTSSSYALCSPGLSSTPNTQINKEVNDANLYVGYLPQSVDESRLRELFSPFGRVIDAKVIKDHSTGFSKGYGFVKYDDPISASTAVAHMNGHKIDGKMLAVRIAGQPPTAAGNSVITLLPKYPGSAVVSQDSTSQAAWPGPPGSMLPAPQASFRKNGHFGLPSSSIFLGYSDSFPKSKSLDLPPSSIFLGHGDSVSQHLPSSYELSCQFPISSPSSLANFPGNPNYLGSQYQSYFTPPTANPAPQLHVIKHLGSSLTPIPWERTHLPGRDTKIVESEYRNLRTNSGPFHCS
ncbi:hypothetical protein HHK36_001112 [Tetracentron sinense]|uniref:RRM domain-containing protein n=1 Tax=Tetracentron sinense TaxID=13715 RepID=A0A835A290_TETSI|nr:hypothetical protein HHK36_001112 [Tetracentron sinense]